MELIDRPLRASLFQLGLESEDPAGLADFYTKSLGYEFESAGAGLLGTARDRRLEIIPGRSKKLNYSAFALPDAGELEALKKRLDSASVANAFYDFKGFQSGALRFNDPDGNTFIFGIAKDDPALKGGVARPAARLQHVVLATRNIHAILDFFLDVVGFELSDRVLDDEGGVRTAFMRCSSEHHSLAVFAASEDRFDHHCYETDSWDDIRDWSDHFAKSRIPLKWGPGRHGPGNNLFVFIHDPDGNWVELSAELQIVEPDHLAGEWAHEERTLNSWGSGLLRS